MATSKFNDEQLRIAGEFIQQNLGNPALIAEKAAAFGVTVPDILAAANAVNAPVTAAQVTEYFRPTSYQPAAGWSPTQLADAGNFIAQNINDLGAVEAARAAVEQATGLNISSADILAAAAAAQKPPELSRAMADVLSGDVYGGMTARQAYDWINQGIIDQPQMSAQAAQQVMSDLGISSRDVAQAALLDPRISAGAQYALVSNPLYQQGQQTGLAALNANINNFIANALQYQTPAQARQSLENALQSGVLTAGRSLNEYDVQRATGKTLNDLFRTAVKGPQVLGPLNALPGLTESYVPPTAPPPEAPPPALTAGQEGLDPGTAIVGNIPTSAQVRIPQLDTEFRASAPRTPVYDRLGRVTGYEYTPAAKLTPATGSTVFSWTPPGVTSRPRQLLSMQDVPGATFDPVTGEARMPLSASQRFARDRAQLDRDFRQMYAAQAAQDSSLPAQAPASAAQAFRELAMSDPETAMQLKLRDIGQQRFDPAKADMAVRARYGAEPAQAAISSLFAPFINRNMATLQGLAKLQNPVTYSQRRPDVAAAYAALSPEKKKEFPTLLDYEVYHYNTFGKNEDPTLPNPLEQVGKLQSPYSTAFFSKGGEASTEDFIKKQSGGDVSRGTLPPVRLADGSPNPDEVPSVIDEREEVRSESQRMLNRLSSQSKLPPGLQRTIQGARARQGESMIPAAVPARDVMAGMFGAQAMNPGSEAYRTGQALANSPPVEVLKAPAKIASAAGDAATALAALGGAGVIRAKGSNIPMFPESMERGLSYFASEKIRGDTPAQLLAKNKELLRTGEMPDLHEAIINQNKALEKDVAVDEWVNRNLNKYLRSQFASTDDPVRALLDRENKPLSSVQATLERLDRLNMGRASPVVQMSRERYGFPEEGLAQSQAAKDWEFISDRSMRIRDVKENSRMFSTLEQEVPEWYKKYLQDNPEGASTIHPDTGVIEEIFSHVVDVLRADVREGRISPNALKNVSVDQAVQRTIRFDEEMAKAAKQAEKEAKKDAVISAPRFVDEAFQPSFVDKPGGKWINLPEAVNEGLESCTSIGKAGGWCTQSPGLAEAYGSGSKRLIALVDAEGRPHAQITYKPNYRLEKDDDGTFAVSMLKKDEDPVSSLDTYYEPLVFGLSKQAAEKKLDELLTADVLPKTVTEIKPVGNRFSSPQAMEYASRDPDYVKKVSDTVKNFLQSGNWVGSYINPDLQRFGLYEVTEGQRLPGFSKLIPPGIYSLDDFRRMAMENDMPREILNTWMSKLQGPAPFKHGGPVDKTTAFIKAHA